MRPISTALFLLLVFLSLAYTANAQTRTGSISGTVREAATLQPMPGVNVTIRGLVIGAATDADGRFAIPNVPVGTHAVEARFIGFAPFVQTDVVVKPARAASVEIELSEQRIQGEGVTVTAAYFEQVASAPTSTVTLSNEEIRRSPGAAQEITRVLTALPGVASRGETSQDLFVRGGSPSENGFYIDNVFVPNAQHFSTADGSSFGPTGIINTEFVDEITFSTGGFSASYGDRLSSISDIRYRGGNANRITGEVGLNFTGGSLIAEGPITNGTAFVSARRSYLDLLADAIDAGGAPRFGDVQGKVALDLSPSNRLTLLTLYGTSDFTQDAADAAEAGDDLIGTFANEQITVGGNLRTLWGARGYSNTALSYSAIERRDELESLRGTSGDLDQTLRNDYVHARNVNTLQVAGIGVEAGAEAFVERGTFDYAQTAYIGTNGERQDGFDRDLSLTNTRFGGFATITLAPTPRLTVSPGVRVDYGSLAGKAYVQPRLSASLKATDEVTLRASGGVFRQAVPLYILSQNEANESLPHMRADHLIAGVDVLLAPSLKLTVEGFDKQYRDAPQYAADNPLGLRSYVLDARGDFSGALTSDGRARARGIELLLQKKLSGSVYGTISGSYFRSEYRDALGEWRNRTFDTQTQFSAIGGWKPNTNWELSVRWSYQGERPTTPLDNSASAQADAEVRDVARTNEERLPAYHSLYLRADRRWSFRRTNLTTFVSLWNAYSRTNVDDYYWNFTDQAADTREQFSLLPVIGVEFEF